MNAFALAAKLLADRPNRQTNALAVAAKLLADTKEPRADWSREQWDAYWEANQCDKPHTSRAASIVIVKKWHDVAYHGAEA